ncbi:MAG: hypothetical protein DI539_25390 [Flavobacterium psychrophilum]|nr:MAG: hypothetical protein DI539_25390 [Flavobacterium psychrophilum]
MYQEDEKKPMQLTTAFNKIAALKKPIRLICGGMRSSKTTSVLQLLIILADRGKEDILIVAESLPALREGAMKNFFNLLKDYGSYNEDNHNKTENVYLLGDSRIKFLGCEDPDKVRGITSTIVFINECNNVPFGVFDGLSSRAEKHL